MAIILVQNEKTATGDFDHYEDVWKNLSISE